MRVAQVIGRVTLSLHEPAFKGGRWLVCSPLDADQFHGACGSRPKVSSQSSLVAYDHLGAGPGDIVGVVEGAEATAPFENPTPVDAFNACLIDTFFYQPPTGPAAAK